MRNRTALVTGGGRGIGFRIAERLREAGARVLTPTRREMELASRESIASYLDSIQEDVDILVNNAGVNPLGGCSDVSDADFQDTLQINLIAPMRLARGLAPRMIARNYGRIVNISSIWSVVTKQRRISYSASKAGLNGLTRTLAVELAPFNVLVNAVAPGYVNTELTKQNNTDQELDAISKTIPMQRLADPAEIAELVWFLCSEKNSYVTGQTILIDGGYSCL